MRKSSLAAAAAITLSFGLTGSVAAFAQADPSAPHKKIFGYQEAGTGVFHSLNHVVPEATTAPLTGTFEVTFTITLKTAVPTGGSVLCTTDFIASQTSETTGASTDYDEEADSVAKVTGTTATCTVNTPYSWVFGPKTSTEIETLGGSYTISILPAPSTTINYASVYGRSSTSEFVNATTLPATGAITKYAISATL
jgi:hypothetical protein